MVRVSVTRVHVNPLAHVPALTTALPAVIAKMVFANQPMNAPVIKTAWPTGWFAKMATASILLIVQATPIA
mgnify:CR=1 FL=1